jgi:hypothetical protein
MLHQAGLKPDLMDLKPLLLARVVKEKTAIILDVQPNEFDIVIMVNGIPQPIRTVSFPSETLSWQKKLPMIKNELNRTIEFYQSNNPEWPLAPDVPVFVSGEIAYESEHLQSISDEVGHPVLPISPPLEYPAGLDPHRYMANIGLVLKKLSFNETGLSVTHLNVLPEVYQPEPISLIHRYLFRAPARSAYPEYLLRHSQITQPAKCNQPAPPAKACAETKADGYAC